MPSPETSLVVIACPHCGTRYQLAYAAIGAKGRNVACAHCGQSWEAHAPPPAPSAVKPAAVLDAEEETALDRKLEGEEQRHREQEAARPRLPSVATGKAIPGDPPRETGARSLAQGAGKPSPGDQKRQEREFSKRQQSLYNTLPRARARRLMRFAALGALIVVFGGGVVFRNAIVGQFPQLAASYAAIGLKVNVVGLAFSDLSTVKSLEDGAEVLVVDGKISNIEDHQVTVPPVIVTLTNRFGGPLYAWSMTPRASELEPGEVISLETRLTSPPEAATGVRLSFADGEAQAKRSAPPASGMDDSLATDDDTPTTTNGEP